MVLTEVEARQLEQMIDEHGMREVCEAIARIAWGKAEHIESNWQDKELAKVWEKTGLRLMNLANNFTI
jgi:hypothetical protein